ncbi:MAG: hypothetical protein ACF8R7_07205, partial [Phycisphaerales bacterium JB039]
ATGCPQIKCDWYDPTREVAREDLAIQMAVPYRILPVVHGSGHYVFSERVRHQVTTMYVYAAIAAASAAICLAGLIVGWYSSWFLPSFAVVAGLPLTAHFLRRARSIVSRELWIDPKAGSGLIGTEKGDRTPAFEVGDSSLRILRLCVRRKGPWGYVVVFDALDKLFPMAVFRKRPDAERYVRELPIVLRNRLTPDSGTVEVTKLWPRGWSDRG